MDRSSCLLCVRLDRCWNGHWRCLLFFGFLLFGIFLLIFVLRDNNSGPVIDSSWQTHWSQTQDSDPGSKHVIDTAGSAVKLKEQFVEQYAAQERDPEPDDGEYYDRDTPDVIRRDFEYIQQYRNDEHVGKLSQAKPGSMGIVPDMHDYSLQENFRQLFRKPLDENIIFEENYANPCWAESLPKLPYQNNSYLRVKEQVAILEPQFKFMRQLFAKRTDPSNHWRLRCLPYFYVMETPPMATPRLFNALRFHPLIVNPEMTEPEFWNQQGPDDVAKLRDYLDLYDLASEKIRNDTNNVMNNGRTILQHKLVTGDGTSSYLWTLDSWRRLPGNLGEAEPKTMAAHLIKRVTPKAKIVMVLRNPTERLFQGYILQNENPTASDFHTKAGQALKAMQDCSGKRSLRACVYDSFINKRLQVRLRIGMYYPFVNDWISVFGKENVKVVRYEDYVSNPSEIINEVCAFLGLTPYPTKGLESMEVMIKDMEKKRKANQKLKMMSTTRKMLKEFHRSLNEELATLLGDEKFTWPELINDPDEATDQSQNKDQQEREQKEKDREREDRERQDRERQENEKRLREDQQRQQQQRDQQQREQQQREQQQREQQQRDQQQREQQQREQQRDQQQKEQQQREQQQKEQQQREQQQREQQQREQLQKDLMKARQAQQLQFQAQQNQQQGQQFQQQGQQNQQPGQQGQQNQQPGQQGQQNQQVGQQGQQNQQLGQQGQQNQQQAQFQQQRQQIQQGQQGQQNQQAQQFQQQRQGQQIQQQGQPFQQRPQ